MSVALALVVALASCGARTGLDVDDSMDASTRDAGRADAGRRDAGRLDAGRFDAGPPDAGPRDGGRRDAGPPDAGPPDAGPPSRIGCADGEREAFRDLVRYPDIAGCGGGWSVPGIYRVEAPRCGRGGGDDGMRPDGLGCNVADLCEPGWHVCATPLDVAASSPDGCTGAGLGDGGVGMFFATRISGPGCGNCATGTRPGCNGTNCLTDCAANAETTNDVFGCGTIGDVPGASCSPLNRFSNDQCTRLPAPWSCPDPGAGIDEALTLVKRGPAAGGILCCRD
jgi:hypothetical protein